MTGEHDLQLSYTIDDDGIWLYCSGSVHEKMWQRNLGFSATPDDVARAAADHLGSRSTSGLRTVGDVWAEHGHADRPCEPADAVWGKDDCRLAARPETHGKTPQ